MTFPQYPPGPGLFRRVQQAGFLRQNAAEFFLSNAQQYGDLVHYKTLGRHVFQCNHPDMVQEVLVRDAAMQHRGIVMQRAKFVLGEGLLTSEEPLHMRQRRLVQPAFHRARIAAYGETMLQFTQEMTQRWNEGQVQDLHHAMLQLTLRITGKCLFNTDVAMEVQTISAAVTAFMDFLPIAFLPYPELVMRLPISRIQRIHQSQQQLDQLIYGMVAERRQSSSDFGDLLSMLLSSQDAEENSGAMTDKQVRDECLTLLLAGHETTANALSFALFLMAKHPEMQYHVSAEANAILSTAANATDAYSHLTYTRQVVAESLRLYPPVWVTARTAAVDYEYRGYPVPAGSILIVPQICIHRDPRFFTDPMRFDPDRFLPENIALRPKNAYFPFGAGSRICVGENFAWMEGVLVLAAILRDWHLDFPTGQVAELPLRAAISLRPRNGLPLRMQHR